jgi:hypothetical protein
MSNCVTKGEVSSGLETVYTMSLYVALCLVKNSIISGRMILATLSLKIFLLCVSHILPRQESERECLVPGTNQKSQKLLVE